MLYKKWAINICLSVGCLIQPALALPGVSRDDIRLFFGHDDREYIISEQKHFPWAAIGVLEMQSGVTCTATLISPDTVLTAGHCFWMNGKKQDHPVTFLAGKYKETFIASYKAGQVMMDPAFARGLTYRGDDVYIDPKIAHLDVALVKVHLSAGKAPEPFPIFKGDKAALHKLLDQAKWRVTQAGYAADRDKVLTAHRQCRLTKINKNLTLYHQCDTLSGDSGSPVWITMDNQPQLIAVQSSAPDVKDRSRADNVAVSVLSMRKILP